MRGRPLIERKALLAKLLEKADDQLHFTEHLEADGEATFCKACELRAEGIVSKRASSTYRSGRSQDWLKRKYVHEQELVIAGFTLPTNGIHGIGALLLGYFENHKLIYAGRSGTGFTQKTHRLLRDKLEKLRSKAIPFGKALPAAVRRGAIWVKPELVAQVRFANWTSDGFVRQASFKGLREDKSASKVRREQSEATPKSHAAKHTAPEAPNKDAAGTKSAKRASQSVSSLEPAPVRLTHPDKILYPDSHITKQQLADYYWSIAPLMLPHIANRPLSLVRCPTGAGQSCFFQKHANSSLPSGIDAIEVPDKKTRKPEPYITLSSREALASLAQMSVLEIHPWGSNNDDIEHPDRLIIDLDPDAAIPWRTLAESALDVRKQLQRLKLESFLKSTGGKGLHIVVPIKPEHDWSTVKSFSRGFALMMEKREPRLYLTKSNKAARKNRIYIDYLRNERGATAVAAFSPRARDGAPLALPLGWSDLELPERPIFHLPQYDEWKEVATSEPWKQFPKTHQRLLSGALKAVGLSTP